MPSQKEAPESRALQKVYIHGENGTLITIPQAYVIVENNNEILGQESCSEQSRLVDRNETSVVHIIENTDSRQADEDLTSLNWLQDINVINGIPLQAKGSLEIQTVHAAVSQVKGVALPSSQSGGASEPHSETESSCDGSNLSLSEINLSLGSNRRNEAEDSSNKVILSKPPHSFSTLIFLAIESSPAKAMPVRDIYAWITQHFPYYRYAPAGWKNSVRHNLSLSKSFTKVQQYPGVGKGSLWKVDPLHRPQLIQSLRKIPDISAEQLEQIIAGNSNDNSPAKSSASENAESPEAISKDSLRLTPSSSSSSSSPYSHRSNVPDPALFPYLSRRLQTTPPDNSEGLASSQPRADVDAATAMLALRQEFVLTVPMHSSVKKCYSPRRTRDHSYEQQIVENDSFIHEVQEEVEVRSTTHTSPTEEDHTYSFCPRPSRLRPVHKAINKRLEPTRNHLESYPPASGSRQVTKNEPAALLDDDSDTLESANALLGLAGIKRICEVTEDPPAVRGSSKNGQDQKTVKLSEKRGRGRMRGRSRK